MIVLLLLRWNILLLLQSYRTLLVLLVSLLFFSPVSLMMLQNGDLEWGPTKGGKTALLVFSITLFVSTLSMS